MSETSTGTSQPSRRSLTIGLTVAAGILIAGTVALWAHYGTAVFYEIILAGIALCL